MKILIKLLKVIFCLLKGILISRMSVANQISVGEMRLSMLKGISLVCNYLSLDFGIGYLETGVFCKRTRKIFKTSPYKTGNTNT